MNNSSGNKWTSLLRKSPLKSLFKSNNTNDQSEKTRPWLKKIIPKHFNTKKPATENRQQDNAMVSTSALISLNQLNDDTYKEMNVTLEELATTQNNTTTSTEAAVRHEKDIVPLHQFLRYSVNESDQQTYHRRRLIKPFEPKYEIEWQKNQWLQLDQATCKQIERLRQNGFSKIAIRSDRSLNKHIKYDNPNEMDVLLELSLNNNNTTTTTSMQPEPITCHQPSHFSVRRIHWWQISYSVGEAHLPNWVDPDLCCSAVMMDAPSVLAAISNYSRSSLNSVPRLPDTPTISQKSSMMELHNTYKPLKYTEPPYFMENSPIMV